MSDVQPPLRDGFSDVGIMAASSFFGYRAFKVFDPGDASLLDASPRPAPAGVTRHRPGRVTVHTAEATEAPGGGDFVPSVRGGLRGIFKSQYQWGHATNEALCLRGATGRGQPVSMVRGKPHALMMPECDCGFWSYTNGEHVLSVQGPAALGIIEGWGRCVLGPDGFRAEKARLLALAFPTEDEQDAPIIDAAHSVLADSMTKALHVMSTAFGHAAQNAASALYKLARMKPPPPSVPVITALLRPPQPTKRPWALVTDDLRAAVATSYPTTRLFDSVAAMQAEYPLSDLRALLPPKGDECDTGDETEAS